MHIIDRRGHLALHNPFQLGESRFMLGHPLALCNFLRDVLDVLLDLPVAVLMDPGGACFVVALQKEDVAVHSLPNIEAYGVLGREELVGLISEHSEVVFSQVLGITKFIEFRNVQRRVRPAPPHHVPQGVDVEAQLFMYVIPGLSDLLDLFCFLGLGTKYPFILELDFTWHVRATTLLRGALASINLLGSS